MQALETVMTPLRASRAALTPYIGNLQDGYAGAERYARAKARDLIQRAPRSARLLTNRYVLISLAAGACLLAMTRLQRWRRLNNNRNKRAASRARPRTAARSSPRKTSRSATRVH